MPSPAELACRTVRLRLERGKRWPAPSEEDVHRALELYIGLAESDERLLRKVHRWSNRRAYIIDSVPEKVPRAYGDLLYGQPPAIAPANESDANRLDDLVADDFGAELRSSVDMAGGEGEVWWRVQADKLLGRAKTTWHSRATVFPLLAGAEVVAVCFVDELPKVEDENAEKDINGNDKRVWRHIEMHARGRMENWLYLGEADKIGKPIALTDHTATAELPVVWNHELPAMLAGRIVPRFGRSKLVGRSLYAGVAGMCLALNEASTIAAENTRLGGKQRMVVPASVLKRTHEAARNAEVPRTPSAYFDTAEEAFVAEVLDGNLGDDGKEPMRMLAYEWWPEKSVVRRKDLTETILANCDLVPQYVGAGDQGQAESGTALRVRYIPTINAADGFGTTWDQEAPRVVRAMQLVEQLSLEAGGFGREWVNANGLPTIERTDPLPVDTVEQTQVASLRRSAQLISIRTQLEETFPGREDAWYDQERDRIIGDEKALAVASSGILGHTSDA